MLSVVLRSLEAIRHRVRLMPPAVVGCLLSLRTWPFQATIFQLRHVPQFRPKVLAAILRSWSQRGSRMWRYRLSLLENIRVRMEAPKMAHVTYDDVTEAHSRISPHIHRTPVATSQFIDGLFGGRLSSSAKTFRRLVPSRREGQ